MVAPFGRPTVTQRVLVVTALVLDGTKCAEAPVSAMYALLVQGLVLLLKLCRTGVKGNE